MADSVDDVAEDGGAASDVAATATAAATAALVATAVERSEEDSPTRRRRKASGGHRDRGTVQRELNETTNERQAFEVRLRQLRAEVRLCEASYEALLQREQYLIKEANSMPAPAGNQLPPPQGELGPRFFTIEGGAVSSDTFSVAFDDDSPVNGGTDGDWWDDESPEGGKSFDDGQDMEEVLDHVGIARCRQCGIRLPLDVTAIEEHCRTCFDTEEALDSDPEEESPPPDGLLGRCAICGKELPLTPEGIENHVCNVDGDASSKKQASKSPPPARTTKEKSSRKRSWWRGSPSKSKA